MRGDEIVRLQTYLQAKLNPGIELRRREKNEDSVELYIDGEFLALVYKDDEDPSDISYNMDMAILEMDLPPA